LIEKESREKANKMRQTRKAPRVSTNGKKMIRQLIIFKSTLGRKTERAQVNQCPDQRLHSSLTRQLQTTKRPLVQHKGPFICQSG